MNKLKHLKIINIVFVVLICVSCNPTFHISGSYTNVFAEIAGKEFEFIQNTNNFKYHSSVEGSTESYSSGIWILNKKTIILTGFNDKNINLLNIENKIEYSPIENSNKIVVQYNRNPLDNFTKLDIILNENSKVRIQGDTSFIFDTSIRTIQAKSYLVHKEFLFATSPHIDTLYSPKIEVSNPNKHKIILLKFDVALRDFYRIKLSDTLIVKNSRTLVYHNKEFKKIKNSGLNHASLK